MSADAAKPADEAEQLRAFMAESLALWHVDGTVHAADAPIIAEVRAVSGTIVWVERGGTETPFRWLARWRRAGDAPGGVRELRPRACGSLVGLLAALREALGVERGSPIRVVSAPEPA